MVEEGFRLNIKYSLQLLAKAIIGDGKTGLNPLFKVQVLLTRDKVRHTLIAPGQTKSVKVYTPHTHAHIFAMNLFMRYKIAIA